MVEVQVNLPNRVDIKYELEIEGYIKATVLHKRTDRVDSKQQNRNLYDHFGVIDG